MGNAAAEYQGLENASDNAWNDENEIAIGGVKYRRMKKGDATDVRETDSQWRYYQWEDDASWHYFRYEPIKWRVLQVNGDRCLLWIC